MLFHSVPWASLWTWVLLGTGMLTGLERPGVDTSSMIPAASHEPLGRPTTQVSIIHIAPPPASPLEDCVALISCNGDFFSLPPSRNIHRGLRVLSGAFYSLPNLPPHQHLDSGPLPKTPSAKRLRAMPHNADNPAEWCQCHLGRWRLREAASASWFCPQEPLAGVFGRLEQPLTGPGELTSQAYL